MYVGPLKETTTHLSVFPNKGTPCGRENEGTRERSREEKQPKKNCPAHFSAVKNGTQMIIGNVLSLPDSLSDAGGKWFLAALDIDCWVWGLASSQVSFVPRLLGVGLSEFTSFLCTQKYVYCQYHTPVKRFSKTSDISSDHQECYGHVTKPLCHSSHFSARFIKTPTRGSQ